MTEFQRNIKDYVGHLKEKKTPLPLTVNGRAELVVQDAESYQALLDPLERAETIAAIRQGMKEFEEGKGRAAMAFRVDIIPDRLGTALALLESLRCQRSTLGLALDPLY